MEFIEKLRNTSYALPSEGEWFERNGDTIPNNACSQAADIIEAVRAFAQVQCDANTDEAILWAHVVKLVTPNVGLCLMT
ncbi:MAG: hypothetical protein KKC18_07880 [Chloroflexi bacterium]|nr:hypothetical protein [Chloroflexota bacterium]